MPILRILLRPPQFAQMSDGQVAENQATAPMCPCYWSSDARRANAPNSISCLIASGLLRGTVLFLSVDSFAPRRTALTTLPVRCMWTARGPCMRQCVCSRCVLNAAATVAVPTGNLVWAKGGRGPVCEKCPNIEL